MLIAIMMVVSFGVTILTYTMLYHLALNGQKERLRETAQSRARLIESVARFDMIHSQHDTPGGAFEATMSQIREAHRGFYGFGETGEFTLAQRKGDHIVFLLNHRHGVDSEDPVPVDMDSNLAEPMRRALTGQSGTVTGLDYRGATVLAAHEPVGVYGMGIVAKIDMDEIRAPFIRSAFITLISFAIFISVGAFLFLWISKPIVEKLRSYNQRLQQEVTLHKETSDSLNEQKQRLASLMHNLSAMVYRSEPNPRRAMRFVSRYSIHLLGYSEEELTQKTIHFHDLIEEEDQDRVLTSLKQALEQKDNYCIEYRLKRKDGKSIWVMDQGEAVSSGHDGSTVLDGIITDINDRKLMADQMLQSQKMEAVGRLAGGIAHDFNNLLTGISGHVSLLIMDAGLEPDNSLVASLNEINDASQRASELTRQLLAFSRKQLISPKIVDLNKLLSNLERMLSRLIGEDIHLSRKADPGLGFVNVDPGQLEQVIINLVVNARDSMPNGGDLFVETDTVHVSDDQADRQDSLPSGTYAVIRIRDTGEGMDVPTQAKVFEPFFTTKKEGKGVGLGLATSYGIIQQHNGSIKVDSTLGEGTTFSVYLPEAKEGLPEPETDCQMDVGSLPRGKETILVVEDEDIVRLVAVKLLQRQGYHILEATDGLDALQQIADSKPKIDLLMTDVIMPKMNGKQLADEVVKYYSDIKILFASGYTENVIARHGMLDESINFIAKPYTAQGLAEKVRLVLDT